MEYTHQVSEITEHLRTTGTASVLAVPTTDHRMIGLTTGLSENVTIPTVNLSFRHVRPASNDYHE